MALVAGAERVAPIHHSTFRLSDEPLNEPLERFESALAREPERVAWRQIGQTVALI
jgi:L-ascorbate metabolism protein UlaG (beta-lactamase superfamily)